MHSDFYSNPERSVLHLRLVDDISDVNKRPFVPIQHLNNNISTGKKSEFYGQPILNLTRHLTSLESIYAGYGDRVSPEAIARVKRVEAALSLDRTRLLVLIDKGGPRERASALLRIYNGSVRSSFSGNEMMPAELMMAIEKKHCDFFDQIRFQNKKIFEIGKYWIDHGLSPEKRSEAKKMLSAWVRALLEAFPPEQRKNIYFVSHVKSKVHQLAYQRHFGFKPVPEETKHGFEAEENVLYTTAEDFLSRLNELIEN